MVLFQVSWFLPDEALASGLWAKLQRNRSNSHHHTSALGTGPNLVPLQSQSETWLQLNLQGSKGS